LLSKGLLPCGVDLKDHPENSLKARTFLIGKVSGLINEVLPAATIVNEMVRDAAERLQSGSKLVVGIPKAKL
jgi:hypothetical protein